MIDRPLYPRIDPPERQPDGTYLVRVHRAPNESEDVPAKTLKAAQETYRFFERAAVLLVPSASKVRRPGGRPPKLTPELQAQLCEYLEAGHTLTAAAGMVDVTPRTVEDWLKRGSLQKHGKHAEFSRAYARARRIGQHRLEAQLLLAARSDAKSLLEVLRRIRPEDWAVPKTIEVSGPDGGPVPMVSGEEALKRLEAILARRARAASSE